MQRNSTLYREISNEWFNRNHGLPSHQVHRIIEHNSLFWLATPSGLVIFDGVNATILDKKNGLLTHGLRDVTEHENKIIVCSDKGIERINPTTLEVLEQCSTVKQGLGWCQSATSIANNQYLIACAKGLRVWDTESNTLQRLKSEVDDEFIINIVGFANEQALIHANQSGIWLYAKGTIEKFSHDTMFEYGSIKKLIKQKQTVWVVTDNLLIELNQYFHFCRKFDVPQEITEINALLAISSNNLFIADANKLYQVNFETNEEYQIRTIQDQIIANALTIDPIDNVWVATESSGLLKVSCLHQSIHHYVGINKNPILSIQPLNSEYNLMLNNQTRLLVAGASHSFLIPSDTPEAAIEFDCLQNQQCWDLQSFDGDSYWAATNNGLVHINDPKQTNPKFYQSTAVGAGRCLQMINNNILYGSVSGLFLFDISTNKFTSVSDQAGTSIGYVYSIVRTSTSHYYLATLGNGLWSLDPNNMDLTKISLLTDTENVYSVDQDDEKRLIIAADNKLLLVENGVCKLVHEVENSVMAWCCTWHSFNQVVLGTSSGLKVFDLKEKSIIYLIEGFPNRSFWEFTTARSIFKSADNYFWLGLDDGLNRVKLESLIDDIPAPVPIIKNIKSNQLFDRSYERIKIVQGNWWLDIQLDCSWLWLKQSIKYQYRLIGLSSIWHRVAGCNINLTTLPAGEYLLEVKLQNDLTQSNRCHSILAIEVCSKNFFIRILTASYQFLSRLISKLITTINSFRQVDEFKEMEALTSRRTQSLRLENEMLKKANQKLALHGRRDQLTGFHDINHFMGIFKSEIRRAQAQEFNLCIMIIGIDEFYKFKSNYGTSESDDSILKLATLLSQLFEKNGDIVARLDSDHFILLLRDLDQTQIEENAVRLLSSVYDLNINNEYSSINDRLTTSIGMTNHQPKALTEDTEFESYGHQLLDEANESLSEASKIGNAFKLYVKE